MAGLHTGWKPCAELQRNKAAPGINGMRLVLFVNQVKIIAINTASSPTMRWSTGTYGRGRKLQRIFFNIEK
jgi:hypothetical protein